VRLQKPNSGAEPAAANARSTVLTVEEEAVVIAFRQVVDVAQ